jgi:hypothetical protein
MTKRSKNLAILKSYRLQRALLFVGQKVGKKPSDFKTHAQYVVDAILSCSDIEIGMKYIVFHIRFCIVLFVTFVVITICEWP